METLKDSRMFDAHLAADIVQQKDVALDLLPRVGGRNTSIDPGRTATKHHYDEQSCNELTGHAATCSHRAPWLHVAARASAGLRDVLGFLGFSIGISYTPCYTVIPY